MSECIVQIIRVVFNLIIIRVEKQSAFNPTFHSFKDLSSLQFQERSVPVGETTTRAGNLTVEQAEMPAGETTAYANALESEATHV